MKTALVHLALNIDPRLIKLVILALALAAPYIIDYPGCPADITV